ncbi:MAG: 2,3-bisphosphoglycerate-independent phosphoglycerate mutase [Eggerthellaceae bacterium]|nr:2,3-bisphosphoglycerate-independent phosphoglycerate mutase [Eggerthellaceae bacterium]
MQYAVVILDGASGNAVELFDGRTSLEESWTPNLDALARAGMVGLMQNVPDGFVSGSDVACLSLMGYDPALCAIGRGAIEAAALGIDLESGQVAFRMNLCNIEGNIMRSYSTDNIATEDGHEIVAQLKRALDDETFTLYPGTSFRQALVMQGGLPACGCEFWLPHDFAERDISAVCKPKAHDAAQQKAADALIAYMAKADEVLATSPTNARRLREGLMPANRSWVFWPGTKPGALAPFQEAYGKSAAMNSAVDLLIGLAKLTGVKTYQFAGVTDGPGNDFAAQGAGAITMLEDGNDVVFVHVEPPDAAGHDGRPAEKKNAIEESDRHILGPLLAYAQTHPLRIAVMPDHPTPLATRKHGYEPVPFVVAGPGIAPNGAERMTEEQAKATGVYLPHGHRFIGDVLLAPER